MIHHIRIEAEIEISDYGTDTGGADAMLFMAAHVESWRRLEKSIDEGFMKSVTYDSPNDASRPGYGTVRMEARLLSIVFPAVPDVPVLEVSPDELERKSKIIDVHLARIRQQMRPDTDDTEADRLDPGWNAAAD